MNHKTLAIMSMAAIFALQTQPVWAQGRRGGPGKGKLDKRETGSLKNGQKAPDFDLKMIGAKKKVKLSTFRGKKPVVLVFGSYT